MKQYAIASLLLLGLVAPAFAANDQRQDAKDVSSDFKYNAKQHWAVIDTQGNCAVVDTRPSSASISGLKILGDRNGYSSLSSAQQALKSDKACKGNVGRS
jgi:hypothetical protein